MIQAPLSRQYSQKLEKLIPGGVNSPFAPFEKWEDTLFSFVAVPGLKF